MATGSWMAYSDSMELAEMKLFERARSGEVQNRIAPPSLSHGRQSCKTLAPRPGMEGGRRTSQRSGGLIPRPSVSRYVSIRKIQGEPQERRSGRTAGRPAERAPR